MWLYIIDVIWCNQTGLDTWISLDTPQKPDSEPNSSKTWEWFPQNQMNSAFINYRQTRIYTMSLCWIWILPGFFQGSANKLWCQRVTSLSAFRRRQPAGSWPASMEPAWIQDLRPEIPETSTYKRSNLFQVVKHGKTWENLMKHGISKNWTWEMIYMMLHDCLDKGCWIQ